MVSTATLLTAILVSVLVTVWAFSCHGSKHRLIDDQLRWNADLRVKERDIREIVAIMLVQHRLVDKAGCIDLPDGSKFAWDYQKAGQFVDF